jgi:hypothetical protein
MGCWNLIGPRHSSWIISNQLFKNSIRDPSEAIRLAYSFVFNNSNCHCMTILLLLLLLLLLINYYLQSGLLTCAEKLLLSLPNNILIITSTHSIN